MTVIFDSLCNSLYIRCMKPWVRLLIVFFAYGMALLHTAVPHHHDSGSGGRISISHAGCVFSHSTTGLLQLVFSTDLGYGHLEIFKKNADTTFEFSAVPAAFVAILSTPLRVSAWFTPDATASNGYNEKLRMRLLLFSASPFRAPPILA